MTAYVLDCSGCSCCDGVVMCVMKSDYHDISRHEYTPPDLTEEEIEYDYLQREQELQDEEDCYLQQMSEK